jgi:hypothetical protein
MPGTVILVGSMTRSRPAPRGNQQFALRLRHRPRPPAQLIQSQRRQVRDDAFHEITAPIARWLLQSARSLTTACPGTMTNAALVTAALGFAAALDQNRERSWAAPPAVSMWAWSLAHA